MPTYAQHITPHDGATDLENPRRIIRSRRAGGSFAVEDYLYWDANGRSFATLMRRRYVGTSDTAVRIADKWASLLRERTS